MSNHDDTPSGRNARFALWAVLVLGVALIAAPLLLGIPDKAEGGQAMMDDFRPIMAADNVETTSDYYYDVFRPLEQVVPVVSEENVTKFEGYLGGISAMGADAQNLVTTLAAQMNVTPEQVQQYMAVQFPAMSAMLQNLPQMEQDFTDLIGVMAANVAIFQQVPAGLDHYEPLVTTMEGNVGNYDEADSMPNFNLITWFFVIPGVALVLLAGFGLFHGRLAHLHLHHPTPTPVH